MIRIQNVSKHFGNLLAVNDLSLEIHRGEIFGLLGPNGAGKSTMISMISGQQLPTSGQVQVKEFNPTSSESKRLIGVAPQSIALYEELSALDNLAFFGSLYALSSAQLKRRSEEVLDFVGLAERATDRVNTYSGGMKRRLNLAVTLMHEPDILLLDEPTVGVDPQSRNKLFDSILALRDQGKTILYTTHYMEEAERLCDRVGIVDQGKLLALDSVENLIHTHGGESLLTITSGNETSTRSTGQPIAELQSLLAERHDITNLRLQRPDLEKVFLNLTGRQLRD